MASTLDELLAQVLYQNKKKVREDISKLLQHSSTLLPRSGTLTNINGDSSTVIAIYGTLPIYFSSVQYNIPVEILVPHKYPFETPKVYVRPTSTMAIEENHNYVDMNGLVILPYLYDWKSSSNLVSLADDFSLIFSAEPPLYSIEEEPVNIASTESAASTTNVESSEPISTTTGAVLGNVDENLQNSVYEPWNSSTKVVHHDIPLNSLLDEASPSRIPSTNSKTYRGSSSTSATTAAANITRPNITATTTAASRSVDDSARNARLAEATRRIRDELFSIQESLLAGMDVSSDKKLEESIEEALAIMKMSLLNNLLQFQNEPEEVVMLTKLQQFSPIGSGNSGSSSGSGDSNGNGTSGAGTAASQTSKGRSPVRSPLHNNLGNHGLSTASVHSVPADNVPPPPPPLLNSDDFSTLENSNFVSFPVDDRSIANDTVRSNGPSSISELLEQGQNAGRYAQMLREILRQMSKDDSKVQLKSLEQVLRLGQTIAAVESSALAEKAGRGVSPEKRGSPERLPKSPTAAGRLNLMAESRTAGKQSSAGAGATATVANSGVQETPAKPVIVVAPRSEIVGDITSRDKFVTPASVYKQTKVPGHIPSGAKKNKNNKVFGHPAS